MLETETESVRCEIRIPMKDLIARRLGLEWIKPCNRIWQLAELGTETEIRLGQPVL